MNPDKRKARSLSEFTRNQDEGELLVSNLKMLLVFFDENFDKICAYENINTKHHQMKRDNNIFR